MLFVLVNIVPNVHQPHVLVIQQLLIGKNSIVNLVVKWIVELKVIIHYIFIVVVYVKKDSIVNYVSIRKLVMKKQKKVNTINYN